MANIGKITPTTTTEQEAEDNMTCAICHEVYKTPKLLECTHTFCQGCLLDFVGLNLQFHCPMCRREIRVPPGGVTAFRSNPYIRNEDLAKARATFLCSTHAKKELELYCTDCDVPICVLCMMEEHVHHDMKTISQAALDVQAQLQADQTRIHQAVDEVTNHVKEAKGKMRTLQGKKAAVDKDICNRHATLVAAADRLRDDALNSLETVSQEIEEKLSSDLQQLQDNLNDLKKLKNTLDKTLLQGLDYERATVAKDMRSGEGRPELVLAKAGQRIGTVIRPVLRCGEADDSWVVKKMGEYLGEVVRLERRESMAVGRKPRAVIMARIRSGVL